VLLCSSFQKKKKSFSFLPHCKISNSSSSLFSLFQILLFENRIWENVGERALE